jgi:hypothetical protein
MLFMLRKNGTTRFLFRFIAIALPALLFSTVFVTASSAQNPTPQHEPTVTRAQDSRRVRSHSHSLAGEGQ